MQRTGVQETGFHIKGNAYLGTIAYIETHVTGGLAAVLGHAKDEQLSAFCNRSILAGSWYDIAQVIVLSQAAAAVAGMPLTAYYHAQSTWVAARDISGVYKVLLRLASPDQVMNRVGGLAKQHFDSVMTEVTPCERGHYRTRSSGVPEFCVDAYRAVSEAYVGTALRLAGARELSQMWQPPEALGQVRGYAIVALQRDVRWAV